MKANIKRKGSSLALKTNDKIIPHSKLFFVKEMKAVRRALLKSVKSGR